ncbi:MAG TPA: putative Ig domain-containing protein, partial [Blastocatellia bacterium]|nr:putative Ig domain-containing protein [Blastocatellia bacterium]
MNRLFSRIFPNRRFRLQFTKFIKFTKPQLLILALGMCLLAVAVARLARERAAAQGIAESPNLSQSAQQQIKALLDEKARRSPAQQKLDSQLLYAVKMRRGEEIAPGIRQLSVKVETDAEAKTVVDITAIIGGSLIADLDAAGVEVLSVYAQYNSLRARAPLARLEEIAALPQVRFIQPKQEPVFLRHAARARAKGETVGEELPPGFAARANRLRGFLAETLAGSKTSEGDVTHRAAAARTTFGANGAGVRIGVLSDGVANLAASQASGDLPANVTVLQGYVGSGDEGTAMLEIINDLAPGAQLYFATANGGIAGFAQAIRDLRAAGCDIIVDDFFYVSETPFQDGQAAGVVSTTNGGILWQVVNDVTASGALYFSAAGNDGNKNDNTSGTWEGDFTDGGTLALVPGGTVHNFGGGTQFNAITVTGSVGSLFWADPLGGSSNDYDLFVLNSAGTAIVTSSTNTQSGTQDPFEAVAGVSSGNRLVILKKAGAANRFLHLENLGGQLTFNTEGNIRGHACAAAAYAVAATPAATAGGAAPNPTGPFPNPFVATNVVERFSSDGPRRVFFNANGTPLTPGNFSAAGGALRQKPDITAADGVTVTGAGGFPTRFFGTSAAAPHAAAIAALLRSANSGLTAAQVRTALTSSAIDIEGAGVDRDSGAGIIMAFQALQSINAQPAPNLQTGTIAAAETGGNGNTFIERGESATLNVQLLNTGPVSATGISAVLTTNTPGVNISAGTSAYANLAATTGAATNTTPFAFNLSATASCPLRVEFTLTLTFTGGGSPKVLPFYVQTGQPPLTISSTLDAVAPNPGTGFTTSTGLQNARLTRDGNPTFCGTEKSCPGTTSTGTRRYDAYNFSNCSTVPSCITVTLDTPCNTGGGSLFAAAYLGSFDQNNVCLNYLADPGLSPGAVPAIFSFTVPAGANFTVVVSEVNSGVSANCNYTMNLTGLCCVGNAAACPTVSQLAPATGVPGSNLMITGSNLANVSSVKFAGDVAAGFSVVSNSILNVVIPNSASSGPIRLGSPACPDVQTANFAYPTNLGTNNEAAVDDGTMEVIFSATSSGKSYYVNRLTPTSYPATLTKVAIFFPSSTSSPPSGTPFEVITAANSGGGSAIDGIKFTATPYNTQPGGAFSIFNVPPLTITSGDFVVGLRIPFVTGQFPAAADTSSPSQGRSYFSTDGLTFTLTPRNFGFRAATLQNCQNVTNVSPASGAAGAQVVLTGTGLNGVTAVKFFNNVTAQFTVNSPTQITTTIPAAAVTGPITLSKNGCPDMTTSVFVVGACPTVSGISPASGSVGATVTINGANFTGVTGVKFANNVTAQFTVVSATQITATVPAGALNGPITISKPNCSDVQTAAFTIACPAVTVNPATLPDGAGGVAYNQTLTATGGTSPYSFTVTAGALPAGLTLATNGTLSGAPAAAGAFNFTATATDANNCTGTRVYTLNVSAPQLGAQTRALYVLNECNGCANQIYGYAVNETTGALILLPGFPVATGGNGGSGAFSERLTIDRRNQRLYAVNDSTDTVSAFAINPTTGALTALPFSPISLGSGTWATVAVHPSGSPLVVGDALAANRKVVSFVITASTATPALGSPFNTGSAAAFSAAFSQDGNYLYAGGNAFNNFFAGFSVNAATGVLTPLAGAPFNSGAVNPLAYATDISGRVFLANVDAGQVRALTTSGGVPTDVSGNPFTSGLTAAAQGVLHPNGFYLVADRNNSAGGRIGVYKISGSGSATTLAAISGSPFNSGATETNVLALNQAGSFLFAADGNGRMVKTFSVNTSTGALTLSAAQLPGAIGAAGRLNGMAYFTQPCETVSLTPSTLPGGTINTAYNQTVSAAPTGTYNFSITAGALPAGLSLNSSTGAITGTATAAGTANFTVTALSFGGCSGSQAYSINIQALCPTISNVTPTAAPVGATITLTGVNFNGVTQVRFGGVAANFTVVSNTQLTTTVPAGAVSGSLTISKPDCQDVSANFAVVVCPTVTSLSAASGIIGSSVNINGSGFTGANSVRFSNLSGTGAAAQFIVVSDTQITATVPAGAVTGPITISEPGCGDAQTAAFTVIVCQTISSIAPTVAAVGSQVTINGSGFTGVTGVRFNNISATFNVVSDSVINVTVPANASTGLIVVSKLGCLEASAGFTLIVCPTITGVTPTTATVGQTLTINGSGLTGVSAVRFTNNVAAQFTIVSDTQITAVVPAGATDGPVTISETGCANVQTAALTILLDTPRVVRAVNASGAPGTQVAVPIELVSQGDENALGMSLTFDATVLSNPQAALGSDATSGQINSNAGQAAQGRFGLVVSLGTGQRFSAGTRQVAVVTFTIAANAAAGTTAIGFGNQPIPREISDTEANILPANYTAGTLTIVPGYEADVAPRPNGTGDGNVTTADWVLVGRFAAGLDTPSAGSEFQRADCAPKNNLGDGRLTINDWVQAGRYAAGLDSVVPAGGPTAPVNQLRQFGQLSAPGKSSAALQRTTGNGQRTATQIRAALESLASTGQIAIELDAWGGENALGFSLQFNPAQWRFVSARAGQDAAGAALHVNTAELAAGRIGLAVAMPAGESFAAGTRQVALLRFEPVALVAAGRRAAGIITFADQPLARELADVNAHSLPAEYSVRTENVTAKLATIVSAAGFRASELASESIATAFGAGLATMTQTADSLPLPFDLAGTRVTVTDSEGTERPAPLFFVSPAQINYLIPAGTAEGPATVTIFSADGTVSIGAVNIASLAPSLFSATADGQGIASAILLRQRADGSQQFEPVARFDSASNRIVAAPVNLGAEGEQVFLILFGTGLRHRHTTIS